jgi:Cu-Zn family superoxide dismutase
VPDPVQPSVDPAHANPENEIWLDLTTDADGAGGATTTVPWGFESGRRARSVVVHAMPPATDPAGPAPRAPAPPASPSRSERQGTMGRP